MPNSLRRLLRRAAIPHLTVCIIVMQAAVYACLHAPQAGLQAALMSLRMMLIPELVLAGEWWRLFTFVVLPPSNHLIWMLIFWWFFYFAGTALESLWGALRYNAYLGVWWMATLAAVFATGESLVQNYYLEVTVLLAFAWCFPEFQLLLAFVIPVKAKWLGWATWCYIVYELAVGEWTARVVTVASVLNFLLFFGRDWLRTGRLAVRRQRFRQRVTAGLAPAYRHKCHSCGVTDAQQPGLEFRYCSQCDGQLCYCSDHLRTHEHVRAAPVDVEEVPQ